MTVAMYAAQYGYIKNLPKKLYHDPTLKNNNIRTVAILMSMNGYIKDLPGEFYHDACITDKDG